MTSTEHAALLTDVTAIQRHLARALDDAMRTIDRALDHLSACRDEDQDTTTPGLAPTAEAYEAAGKAMALMFVSDDPGPWIADPRTRHVVDAVWPLAREAWYHAGWNDALDPDDDDAPPLADMVGAIPDLTGGRDPVEYLDDVRCGHSYEQARDGASEGLYIHGCGDVGTRPLAGDCACGGTGDWRPLYVRTEAGHPTTPRHLQWPTAYSAVAVRDLQPILDKLTSPANPTVAPNDTCPHCGRYPFQWPTSPMCQHGIYITEAHKAIIDAARKWQDCDCSIDQGGHDHQRDLFATVDALRGAKRGAA